MTLSCCTSIQIYRFELGSYESLNKMILMRSDATLAKDIGQDDEDVINQVSHMNPWVFRDKLI